MWAAELEASLGEVFLVWLERVNPKLDRNRAKEDLIEKGAASSLPKVTDLAFHAGLIGEKTRHDLRKVAKLRDRYAHDLNRNQLEDDPEMLQLVLDMHQYKDNKDRIRALPHLPGQRAFLASVEQLKIIITTGHVE